MHTKGKIHLHLKQNIVYKWSSPEEHCSQFYICESSRSLEIWVKEYGSHVTNDIYTHKESSSHPCANTPN